VDPRAAPDRGVLVFGTHRSGTSAATRLVNLLGVPLGVLDDLMSRPQPGSPTGLWESAVLRECNDSILRELGGDVFSPPELKQGWVDTLDTKIDEVQGIFRDVYVGPQWVWKDPRNCLTLPFWRKAVVPDPVCIVVYRNALDVARSLTKNDGHDLALGLALWERYTRDLLGNISRLPVQVSSYDELVDDPLQWCREVSAFLSAHGVSLAPFDESAVLAFVDESLRHSRATTGELDTNPLISASLRDTQRLLADLRGAHEAFGVPDLPSPTGWAEPLLLARRDWVMATRRVHALENRLRKSPKQKEAQRREAELRRKLKRQKQRADALQDKLARLHASRSFRYLRPLRVIASGLRGRERR
jgi:hypothetical protein